MVLPGLAPLSFYGERLDSGSAYLSAASAGAPEFGSGCPLAPRLRGSPPYRAAQPAATIACMSTEETEGSSVGPGAGRCRHELSAATCDRCARERAARRRGRIAPVEVFEARRRSADGIDLLAMAAAAPSDWAERLLSDTGSSSG